MCVYFKTGSVYMCVFYLPMQTLFVFETDVEYLLFVAVNEHIKLNFKKDSYKEAGFV